MTDAELRAMGVQQINYMQQIGASIVFSNWCVKCKGNEGATRIYKGNSLCEFHFKKATKRGVSKITTKVKPTLQKEKVE